ncbi:hypothetical protein ACHAW6_000182 [Cyclotella cf. meneghiniana]
MVVCSGLVICASSTNHQELAVSLTDHISYLTKVLRVQVFHKTCISMQYYTFELDEESQDLCAIITSFGKLLMGLKCSPDIAQSIMESIISGIDDVDVNIDDVGTFSKDLDHQVQLLATILHHPHKNKFTINLFKCKWAIKETDLLGYWLTPRGLKPWKRKIEAILRIDHPRNATELRMSIGCIN